jgi:glycosyltransferase involved in cell wall biosynthesis
VIPNGRDPKLFRPTAKEPVVFSAGRLWDEAKNLEALERVAPRLPWPVFVAGENHHPDGGEIRPHNTRLLGRLSQRALAAWLGRSAIYALPARYEPFGLSVLEAALAGCALVLGDIPSLRETWRNRAVFVPPDDPDALEAAIVSLIEDPDRRQSLAAGARNRALEHAPERMVDGYLEAYGQLLAEGAPDTLHESFPHQVAV